MKNAGTLLLVILLSAGVSADEKPDYKNAIDYMRKTDRLWGIAAVTINKNETVTLFDAETGYGYGLLLSITENVNSVTIKAGESCTLSDGHHAFITYELRELKKNKITFLVKDEFDARSFGAGIEKDTGIIVISPYKKEQKARQSPEGDVLKAAPKV